METKTNDQNESSNEVFDAITRTLGRTVDDQRKEALFSSYKIPVLKARAEKRKLKENTKKRIEDKIKKTSKARRLPFFSKERIYERDLKIMAVDESYIKSSSLPQQI